MPTWTITHVHGRVEVTECRCVAAPLVMSYVRRRQVDEGETTMRTTDHRDEVTVDELSTESARELFDAMALDRMGISGEEFSPPMTGASSPGSTLMTGRGYSTCSWRCRTPGNATCRGTRRTRRSPPS